MGSAIASDSEASAPSPIALTNVRTGLGAEAIATALIDNLHCLQAKLPRHATRNDWYMALAYTVRDRMLDRYIATFESITETNTDAKVVAYLSAEFLTGPHLGNSLDQSRDLGSRGAGAVASRAGSAEPSGAGRGAGPRQRRAGPARRLLHGFAGDARTFRRSATASATSSASSIRRFATAGRSS